ncbi:MAG: DUF4416 family protein [bacterium]|nr:DUF4416 family protein [bacterium]
MNQRGRLAVGITAAGGDAERRVLADALTRRLALEFGVVIARGEDPGDGAARVIRWLAFAEPVEAGRLAALRRHADRVERLYAERGETHGDGADGSAEGVASRVRLNVFWIDARRAVRVESKDASHRIPLGDGVFAELAFCAAEPDAALAPTPWTLPEDARPEARAFFDRVVAICRAA